MSRMNPGAHKVIQFEAEFANGDKITQHSFSKPHLSNGIFLESKNGLFKLIENSVDAKSSYAYQLEYC